MPAFEAMPGMPYWIDLSTSNIAKSSHFYENVLGWDITEVNDGYRMARLQGLPVAGLIDQRGEASIPDTWITYFLSFDLDETSKKIAELGGRVLAEPTDVHLGRMALAVDTAGALFGVIEPGSEESFVAAGEPGTPVWHELTTVAKYGEAVEFYEQLFTWTTSTLDSKAGDDFHYTTALVDGAAFAGIFDAKGHFPAQVPSFWQSYVGVLNADDAVAKAKEFGGDVIREPWDSEFGRMALIADTTGATLTVCEVAEYVEEGAESDDLFDIDLSAFEEEFRKQNGE
ncbi:lactoylglutathione lyase-like protein [Corynebacterium deserti GIMN1.010]|uniref:Lactoylglutathione lyase-like protein n=1 Tax=Corynebacterium deserti GIMN1.010 TaxID=931089 RepID=A0A0M4CUS7_9CORY|nr:VOC family protein [Corynebacterium deserti]ALC04662.1 lactoylglutathione lyase-like protein [Corynebacterium deserti GIMN1.010]